MTNGLTLKLWTQPNNMWKPHRSNRLLTTHQPELCAGNPCQVHNVTAHHMADWPQNYRDDTGATERICPHGVGHPDPDSNYPKDAWQWVHGCDGCCRKPESA